MTDEPRPRLSAKLMTVAALGATALGIGAGAAIGAASTSTGDSSAGPGGQDGQGAPPAISGYAESGPGTDGSFDPLNTEGQVGAGGQSSTYGQAPSGVSGGASPGAMMGPPQGSTAGS